MRLNDAARAVYGVQHLPNYFGLLLLLFAVNMDIVSVVGDKQELM